MSWYPEDGPPSPFTAARKPWKSRRNPSVGRDHKGQKCRIFLLKVGLEPRTLKLVFF